MKDQLLHLYGSHEPYVQVSMHCLKHYCGARLTDADNLLLLGRFLAHYWKLIISDDDNAMTRQKYLHPSTETDDLRLII